jgi:AhpD family alkylhydroperoxidase
MSHGREVQRELAPLARELRALIPDVYAARAATHEAAMTPGALDAKTKELIALAISVVSHCDGCIASHARGAAKAGASLEEVAEMLGVAILMHGGPATVYGPRALAAYKEFAQPDDTTAS